MANPAEKLAQSLQILKNIQEQGAIAIQAKLLTRVHRERLVRNGFLTEVIKGWYLRDPHFFTHIELTSVIA